MRHIVVYGGNAFRIEDLIDIVKELSTIDKTVDQRYYLMDYPGIGMSSNVYPGLQSIKNNAFDLYNDAATTNFKEGMDEIWVICFSIGLGVFSEILKRIKHELPKDKWPKVLISYKGLFSLRKTLNIYPLYYFLGDLNSSRLLQHLHPECNYLIIKDEKDHIIPYEEWERIYKKYHKEKRPNWLFIPTLFIRGHDFNPIYIKYDIELGLITKMATMIKNLGPKTEIEKTFLKKFNEWKILRDNTNRNDEQEQNFLIYSFFTQLLTLVHDNPKLNRYFAQEQVGSVVQEEQKDQ